MTRAALIILDRFNEKMSGFEKVISKTAGLFQNLIPNKVESIELKEEDFRLDIIRIPKMVANSGKLESRLKKLSNMLEKEGIRLAALDEDIENNYDLRAQFNDNNLEVFSGINIFFSYEIRVLKKLLKSKGLEISDVDTVIISDGGSRFEIGYIRYLSPYVKFLTYVSKDEGIDRIIEDLFNDSGFSVRVCSDIKECIGDAGLVINLTKNDAAQSASRTNSRLVVRNLVSSNKNVKNNITVLNDIKIDISSKFKLQSELENRYKYRICEMYILSKLGKLYLLKQVAEENDLKEIYECLKNEGFKMTGLDGINL